MELAWKVALSNEGKGGYTMNGPKTHAESRQSPGQRRRGSRCPRVHLLDRRGLGGAPRSGTGRRCRGPHAADHDGVLRRQWRASSAASLFESGFRNGPAGRRRRASLRVGAARPRRRPAQVDHVAGVRAGLSEGKEVLAFLVDENEAWPEGAREEYRLTAAIQNGSANEALFREVNRNVGLLKQFKAWLNGRASAQRHGPRTPAALRLGCLARLAAATAGAAPAGPGDKQPVKTRPAGIDCYLTRLEHETQHLKLLGLGRSLQVELPISEAYIPLRTTLNRSLELRKTDRNAQGLAEHEEDVDLGEVFRKAADLGEHGVVLLGEPGSGKTTGARQLAWRLASRQSLPEDLGLPAGMTPVFLRFRNLRRATLEMKSGLRVFLDEETRCDDAPEGQESPGADLWNGRAGGLLWILDGLDEVIDPEARKTVSGWVQRALKNRPADRFLVTCRFQGYFREGVPLGPSFVEFHVRRLDDDQVQRFVRDWLAPPTENCTAAASRRMRGPTPPAANCWTSWLGPPTKRGIFANCVRIRCC